MTKTTKPEKLGVPDIHLTRRPPFLIVLVALFLLQAAQANIAAGATVSANTAKQEAVLGSAYRSEKEAFVGQACIDGSKTPAGQTKSTFSFESALSENEAANELGFGAGGRARYGIVEASFAARFFKQSVSTNYSLSAIWLSEYRMATDKLESPKLSSLGKSVENNDSRWAETCGDEYVSEITRGAKLFISIRIDFGSESQKDEFNANFKLAGPLYGAEGTLQSASKRFSKNLHIVVSGLQIGGDASQLTGLFGTAGSIVGFTECTLGDLTKCANVLTAALSYAADVKSGFPSQLTEGSLPGPSPLEYRTSLYSAAGIYPKNYPYLDAANRLARTRLGESFERELAQSLVIAHLLDVSLDSDRRKQLLGARKLSDDNISAILASSKICYETPLDCNESVKNLQLRDIDPQILILPPLPTASFRIMTAAQGVWTRADSTREFGGIMPPGSLIRLDTAFGSANMILYITGTTLKEAQVYFEDIELKTIPLTGGPYSEKFGKGFAILIFKTTRLNHGWQDIDLDGLRNDLEKKHKLFSADGTFYVVIRDAFDRELRVDLVH